MSAKPYNGHRSWAFWNVSLWIGNDEGLYRLALDCKRGARGSRTPLRSAATAFVESMTEFLDRPNAAPMTPDGARYTVPRVMAAIREL